MKRIAVNAVGCGVVLGLCAPSVAGATLAKGRFEDELYLNPGILPGLVLRDGRLTGVFGVEISLHYFTPSGLGLGGFGQWQWMGASSRFCGGAQVTAPTVQGVGVELGMAHETGEARISGTTSVHVAPFISFGVSTLSLRVGIPFHNTVANLPGRGLEGGLNLTVKIPGLLKGPDSALPSPDERTPRARRSPR